MYYGTYLRIPGTDDFSSAEFIGESDHEASEGFVAVEASIVSSYPPIVRRRRSSRFRFRFRGEESRNLTLFGRGSCHESQGAEAVDAAAVTQKDKEVVSSPLATSSCQHTSLDRIQSLLLLLHPRTRNATSFHSRLYFEGRKLGGPARKIPRAWAQPIHGIDWVVGARALFDFELHVLPSLLSYLLLVLTNRNSS
ncbi:hypothetical protein AAC387_Pa02g5171 [Persea americana]